MFLRKLRTEMFSITQFGHSELARILGLGMKLSGLKGLGAVDFKVFPPPAGSMVVEINQLHFRATSHSKPGSLFVLCCSVSGFDECLAF